MLHKFMNKLFGLPPVGEVKINPVTLAFPPELEKVYLKEQVERSMGHVRLSSYLGLFFYGVFGFLDSVLMPEVKEELWFIRYAIFWPYAILMLLFSYTSLFKKVWQAAISSVVLVAGLGIIAMIIIAPQEVGYLYYAGLILVFFYGYTFFKLRFVWASLTGLTIVAAYEIAAIWLRPTPFAVLVNNNFFFLTGNVFGMFTCYAMEFYSRQDFIQVRLLAAEREKVDEANRELERRVRDRTQQHLEANRKLMAEIGERLRTEKALRESEQRFRALSENAPNIIFTLDQDCRFTYVNPAWEGLLGYRPEEMVEKSFIQFINPFKKNIFENLFYQVLTNKSTFRDIEAELICKDGSVRHFSVSGAPNFTSGGFVSGLIGLMNDITERKNSEEQIKFIAYHDPLTGLPNRKSFYERMEDLINASTRLDRNHWALMFLDLDRFKDVNDTMGHEIGDLILKETATRLKKCLRRSDFVYRLGGDEFTIITTQLHSDIVVSMAAQRVLEEVSRPYHMQGREIYLTGSIGISVYPEDGESVEELVKNADMAMYVGKEESNRYCFYSAEMNDRALERMEIERNIRQAIEQEQLLLHYQPIVNGKKNVLGVEALVRWDSPDKGMIMPDKFIPVAEETGAIIPLGEWVLKRACLDAKEWRDQGREDLYVAVNLSARQFKQPNLVEMVSQMLVETGLPPGSLQLELTETSIMDEPEMAVDKMKSLHRLGVRFAVDDFGTGYSSLNYLKRFPVDTLKIDRSFVADASANKEDQEIIRAIISMARNLRMEPLAEGVEKMEQVIFLRDHGCSVMQGFYFGKPMPKEELYLFLGLEPPRSN